MTEYTNVQQAFPELCDWVLQGPNLLSRVGKTRERLHASFSLRNPWERVSFWETGLRKEDTFARLAETLWVLGGRNDVDWLKRYLVRAPEFSDDGNTWRAGYGSRMRHWPTPNGDWDQLQAVIEELSLHPESRRAVISLWDPASDIGEFKDIPCNNWLHFINRNGELHMAIAVRSNDLVWGWHGINTWEWSVLQELIAKCLHLEVGKQTYLIGSLHMYDRHFKMANALVEHVRAMPHEGTHYQPIYDTLEPTHLGVDSLQSWDFQVLEVFRLLEGFQNLETVPTFRTWDYGQVLSPYLRATLKALCVHHVAMTHSWNRAHDCMAEWDEEEGSSDILIALANTVRWKLDKETAETTNNAFMPNARKPAKVMDGHIPQLTEMPQFQEYELKAMGYRPLVGNVVMDGDWAALAPNLAIWLKRARDGYAFAPEVTAARIVQTMLALQAAKARTYGDSWKKHGELLSIYANITRKYDRIEGVLGGGKPLPDEDTIDTIVDLAVYCALYLTWLFNDDHTGRIEDMFQHIGQESALVRFTFAEMEKTFSLLTEYVLDTVNADDPTHMGQKEGLVVKLGALCIAWIRQDYSNEWAAFEEKVMAMA